MAFSSKIALVLGLGSVLAYSNLLAAQATLPPTKTAPGGRKHLPVMPAKSINPPAPTKATAPKATQPAPQVEVPAYIPPPLRPAQMAAVAPRISYQNGRLTVVAENSNLSDILNGIRVATGLKVESVGGAGGERVAATIGPASVRDVLLSLLEGSRYDFIMMGSATDPDRIERVVLTPKSTSAGLSASNAPRPATPPGEESVPDDNNETDSDDNAGFAPAPGQPAPPQPQQPGAAINPAAQPGAQPDAGQGQQVVKTPEQLLQDLRNMQQQQQQQQQQTPATPPTSPDQVQRPPRTSRPQ